MPGFLLFEFPGAIYHLGQDTEGFERSLESLKTVNRA